MKTGFANVCLCKNKQIKKKEFRASEKLNNQCETQLSRILGFISQCPYFAKFCGCEQFLFPMHGQKSHIPTRKEKGGT